MGITLFKYKKEYVEKVWSEDLIYRVWEIAHDYETGTFYWECEDSLREGLDVHGFNQDEIEEVVKYFEENSLYGYDVAIE